MLNRTEIVERLLQIKRDIYQENLLRKEAPSAQELRIKQELDKLLHDIIGNHFSKRDQEEIDKVILKAVCGEISLEMAMVAIKEIVQGFKPELRNKGGDKLKDFYQKGYK